MTEENKKQEKIIYIINGNTYNEEQLILAKLTKEQVYAIEWFLNKFDIDIDIRPLEDYACEEP
jgi:hypothetical protein